MLDITLLGTAALVPLPERALTTATLECAGRGILFDCGEGTQTAARRAGVSLMKTDLIALTHFHGDHIFGLPGLMQTMNCLERTEPLYITGPEGLRDELAPILKLAGWTAYDVRLIDMPQDGLKMSEINKSWPVEATLAAFRTEHRVPSQGYCFTLSRAGKFQPQKAAALGVPTNQWGLLQKGRSVQVGDTTVLPQQVLGEPRKGLKFVFSGDTAACEALADAARDADLLICEGTYGENEQGQLAIDHGHMNFAQAARIAAQAQVKQLWLAHYSQMIQDLEACLPNAQAVFERTALGMDGMKTTLQFEK